MVPRRQVEFPPSLAAVQRYAVFDRHGVAVAHELAVAAGQRLQPAVRAEVGRIMEAFLTAQFDGYRGLRSMKLAASAGV